MASPITNRYRPLEAILLRKRVQGRMVPWHVFGAEEANRFSAPNLFFMARATVQDTEFRFYWDDFYHVFDLLILTPSDDIEYQHEDMLYLLQLADKEFKELMPLTYLAYATKQAKLNPDRTLQNWKILQVAAIRSMNKVYGRLWRVMDENTKSDRVSEAVANWMEQYGLDRDLGVTAQEIRRSPKGAAIRERMDAFAKEIRRVNRGADQEFGADDAIDVLAPAAGVEVDSHSPDAQLLDKEKQVEAEADRLPLTKLLNKLDSGSTTDRTKATLLRLHMGKKLWVEQPKELVGNQPTQDLRRYHIDKENGICPTCRRITRFYRVKGLTPKRLMGVIDELVLFIQLNR